MSVIIHANPPTQADKFVTTNAFTALELIATSLPPLNPNQPNQSKAVPRKTSDMLCY